MDVRREQIQQFIAHWNAKEISSLKQFLDPDVELRSTNVLRYFPESGGRLIGRKNVLDYFEVVLKKIPNFVVDSQEYAVNDTRIVMNSITIDGLLNFYVEYVFNAANKIVLIKSDLSEKF